MRRGLIAANWTMHGQSEVNKVLVGGIKQGLAGLEKKNLDVLICPPFLYISQLRELLADSGIFLGAQNMHTGEQGAFTGEVSGAMLSDSGCGYVIIGHSERRQLFGETDDLIARKFTDAQQAGLTPVLCVGETSTLLKMLLWPTNRFGQLAPD